MPVFPEFHRAVVQWRRVATRLVSDGTDLMTHVGGLPVWLQNSDGAYRLEREPLAWDSVVVDQLTALPQWSRIEEAVSNNNQLRAHFGHVVGSAYARNQIDLKDTLIYLLPRPVWSDDRNDVLLDGSSFRAEYRALEDFLSKDSVTQLSMWLVRGVELDRPIKLDEHTVLRKLNPLEISDTLRGGLIVPRHEVLLPNDPFEGALVGLFFSRKEPKVFDNEPMPVDLEDYNKRILEKQSVVENLQSCAALVRSYLAPPRQHGRWPASSPEPG